MTNDDTIAPWSFPHSIIEREHKPVPGKGANGWRAFKPCLRYEFGFTCIYCRLRETDFGFRPQAQFAVDHMQPQSKFPDRANNYDNCYYACGYCNSSKGDSCPSPEEEARGFRFFDPCTDVAVEHFALDGDSIVALRESTIAQYTLEEVRNINKEHTTKARRRRVMERIGQLIEWRRRLREASIDLPGRFDEFLGEIDSSLSESCSATLDTLENEACRCGVEKGH